MFYSDPSCRANIMHELSLINSIHTGNMNPTNYTLIAGETDVLSPPQSFPTLNILSNLSH